MHLYILRRVWQSIPVVIGVTLLVFLMMHMMPVDIVRMMLTEHQAGTLPTASGSITDDQIEELRVRLGLHRPIPVQYLAWLWDVLKGDLGVSWRTGRAVSNMIRNNARATVELGVSSLLLGIAFGIPLGILAAVKQNSWWDSGATVFSVIGISMPSFWKGLMLLWLFGLVLGWFPSMGSGTWRHLVLPALTLGIGGMALITRLTRGSMVEVLRQDYVTTARSKGLSERVVTYKHGLRNALIPVITIVGLSLGRMLSGAVIVENVFGRPGLGRIAVQAIWDRDFPVVQATVLILAIAFILGNLLTDIAYGFVDPRIRYD